MKVQKKRVVGIVAMESVVFGRVFEILLDARFRLKQNIVNLWNESRERLLLQRRPDPISCDVGGWVGG